MRLVLPSFSRTICVHEKCLIQIFNTSDSTYLYIWPTCVAQVAEDITPDYPALKQLIADMWETLAESEGIGLAAPQIGKSIRLSVIDLDVISDDMPEYKGFRQVFINPHIVEYDESKTDTSEEGCLSLPAIHEKVVRPTRIHVQWVDEDFQPHDEWIEGYLARVMQHEFDHLDGKMFVDRVSPLQVEVSDVGTLPLRIQDKAR